MLRLRCLLALFVAGSTLSGCGGGKSTIVQITDKITSLPAGQTYVFTANVEHNQKSGVTLSLSGAGTLVLTGTTATYIAPPAPPNPNSVTVTVTAGNGSGASDSDTFSISAATGPVISITPATLSATQGGAAIALTITVTPAADDDSSDVLTPNVSSSSDCGGGVCGTFGSVTGGNGTYAVEYTPPSSVTASTLQTINVTSTLANSTMGTAFVTINP